MRKTGDVIEGVLLGATGYVCFSFYIVIGRLASWRGVDLTPWLRTRLDDAIPFMPVFVIPYALAFAAPVLAGLLIARYGGLFAVRRAFFAYFALVAAHFLLYLLVPTSAGPLFMPDSELRGALPSLVRFFYGLSPPWNAWPSLHVAGGWFLCRALKPLAPRAALAFQGWFWLMFASTAAIKIHWVADGIAGFVLAEGAFRRILRPLERQGACSWRWPSPRLRLAVHAGALILASAGLLASL